MTAFDQIDLMARGGSIALLGLWSWILLRDHGPVLAARLAVAMNATIICYLLVTMGWYNRVPALGLLLAIGAGTTPAFFWLFAKAWFNDEIRLRTRDLALVAATAANILVMQLSFSAGGSLNLVSGVIFRAAMIAFAIAAFFEVWRGRAGDLIEGRRKIRSRLIIVVGIYVIVIAISEVAEHNGLIARAHANAIGGLAVLVIFAFCAAMLGMRQSDLFGLSPTQPKRVASVTANNDALAEKLRVHMQSALPHRDETLSIAKLAGQLGEQEYRLRRTINQQMGYRNFAAFLNGYRLAEVKAALVDPVQKDVPIITIALDAGFGSLGPFNRAFREEEGMTPSEYRANAMVARPQAEGPVAG